MRREASWKPSPECGNGFGGRRRGRPRISAERSPPGLGSLLTLAARQGNAEELKRLVRDEAPKVERLILALREFARELFRTLAEEPLERFNTQGLANMEVARAESQRIEAYRVAISNYVVLLDRYRELLKDLAVAYDSPRNPVTLARIAERSAQLSTQADAWRRSLASLRTGLN